MRIFEGRTPTIPLPPMSWVKRSVVRVLDFVIERVNNGFDESQDYLLNPFHLRARADLLRRSAKLCDEIADGLDDLRQKRAARPPEIP